MHQLLPHVFILVVVNFLSQVIFVFLLFVDMVIYADEVETKEKYKLPDIKNSLQHTLSLFAQQAISAISNLFMMPETVK